MREPNLPDRLKKNVGLFMYLNLYLAVQRYRFIILTSDNINLFVSIHFYFRVFSTFPSKHLTSESKRNSSK